MSEEKSPPLKLKSRARSGVTSTAAPDSMEKDSAAPVAVTVSTGPKPEIHPSEDRGLRIRSKPRLSPETAPEAHQSQIQVESRPLLSDQQLVQPTVPTDQEQDPLAADPLNQAFAGMQLPAPLPPAADMQDAKASVEGANLPSGQATSPAPAPPLFATGDTLIGGLASEPMTFAAPKLPIFKPSSTKPIHIHLSEKPAKPAEPPKVRPQDRKAFKLSVSAVAAIAVIGLGTAAFFAFKTFQDLRGPRSARSIAPETAAPRSATGNAPGVSKVSAAKAISEFQPAPASQAGRLIQAARKVTSREDAEMNDILSAGSSGEISPTRTIREVSHATGPTTPQAMSSSLETSTAFVAFADAIRINGVFQGNPARASINGRIVRAGALLDASLGVTFDGIDPRSREIILRDTSGATIRKKY